MATSNNKYYLQSSVGGPQDMKIEVDLHARIHPLPVLCYKQLKRRAQSVNTDEVFAGFLRGDGRSQQTWCVFCDDCVELACIESKLFGRPPRLLTGPGVECVIRHSRAVWAARGAGV